MKYSELEKKFKNKYVIKVVAGALVVALTGGSVGAYQVYAEKEDNNKDTDTKEKKDKKDAEKEDDIDLKSTLIEQLSSATSNVAESDKEETVYVIADAEGSTQSVIVSDWLKNNDGDSELSDSSRLSDIENTKGDESFTQDGEDLTWQADGNDI